MGLPSPQKTSMMIVAIETDRKVFGEQVKTFPDKISEAFNSLMQKIPGGNQRSYYGISWIEDGVIQYYAAAEQKSEGEALLYGAREFTLRGGDYLIETLNDWMLKVDSIKGIFEIMMEDSRIDTTSPAIEWYKSDKEMWCMMRLQ
jgi:hypothetical protein